MKLRFRLLQAFHAIIETGTVTGAADLLAISQPGISNLLSQLENQSPVRLFERRNGRLIPTPEANVLFQEVDTVVRSLDHVQQTLLHLQDMRLGQLQIASQHSLSFSFMPRLISQFARAHHPDLKIEFQSQYSPKIQEWVHAGLYELGVCELPLLTDGLEETRFAIEMQLVMHKSNPLARHEVLTPNIVKQEPFIVTGTDHTVNRALRNHYQAAGETLNIRVQSHLFKNLLSLVNEGMGVALIDRLFLEYEPPGDYVVRPFRPLISLPMAIITSSRKPLSQVGHAFHEELVQALTDHDCKLLTRTDPRGLSKTSEPQTSAGLTG